MQIDRPKLNIWELGAGAVVFAIGAFMAWEGFTYSVGNLRHLGPGYFPLSVGVILMLLAAAILLEVRFADTSAPDLPIRPLAAITLGLVSFAALIDTMGLIPATFVLILLAAFGDRAMTARRALAVAAAVSALGYLIFIFGFRLPINPFWW